jgi:hypothetical protein
MQRILFKGTLGSAIILLSFSPIVLPAAGHEAPSGWAYPPNCCSNYDCREVAGAAISERKDGYVIGATGEVIGYRDARLKNSPDGAYHWCSAGGRDNAPTICLFVPPAAY